MSVKLSIIVPVYNGGRRIASCLESIFRQQYADLELIIIDDGSTDGSLKNIKQLTQQHQDSPISVIVEQQPNHGVAFTRNRGIQMASGDYVAFVDQDDIIAADYCQVYMTEVINSKADIVVGGYERVTEQGKIKKRVRLQGNPWERFVVMAPWAHIYRREFLLQKKIQFLSTGIGEDVYFNFLAYAECGDIKIIDDVGYQWIYNEESVSNSRQNTMNESVDPLYLLDCIYRDVSNKKILEDEFTEYYFARYVCWYMLFSFRGSSKTDIKSMAEKLRAWLCGHYPCYEENRYVRFHKPKGESLAVSVSVWGFYQLQKMKLLVPLLQFFGGKGERG